MKTPQEVKDLLDAVTERAKEYETKALQSRDGAAQDYWWRMESYQTEIARVLRWVLLD